MLRIILVASTVVLFLIFSIPILGILALVGKGNSRAKQDWSLRIVRSVFRFILLSTWMSYVNCLFLDRVNIKEGLKTILEGIEKVKSGVSIWIFPEGTRNEGDLTDLLPFHEGSLKIAEKSGCPVIPVAITGTAEVFEDHLPLIRSSHVVIRYGEPIFLKELEPAKRKFSGAYTRDVIISMLNEMEKEKNN